MSSLLIRFKSSLDLLMDLSSQDKLLIALSGGIDSVVLTDLCIKILGRDRVKVANFNHKLRPLEEQQKEKEVLKELLLLWQVSFFEGEVKEDLLILSKIKKESLEAVAREKRYSFLRDVQKKQRIAYLATAHHKDDQIETFFMSLLSKGSFSSLKGVRSQREDGLIRPLLSFTREEIKSYQKEYSLPYWEDSTNSLDLYTRNKVRLQILPLINKTFPHSMDSFSSWQKRFSDLYDWVEENLPCWEKEGLSLKLRTEDFLRLPSFLKGEILLKGFYSLKDLFSLESYKVKSSFIEELIIKITSYKSLKKMRDILCSAHWKVSFDNFFIILQPIIVKKPEISYLLRVESNQWYSLPWGRVKVSFNLEEPLYLASYDYRRKFSDKFHSKEKKFFSSYNHLDKAELVLFIFKGQIIALWSNEKMDFLWRDNFFSFIEMVVEKGAF